MDKRMDKMKPQLCDSNISDNDKKIIQKLSSFFFNLQENYILLLILI